MDHWTRRIVGFSVHRGVVDGVALCRMFNHATCAQSPPTYLSADHDPLYRFHQWHANLRILNIRQIKTVPYVPRSHPVVERLIGAIYEFATHTMIGPAPAHAGLPSGASLRRPRCVRLRWLAMRLRT